MTTVPLNPSSTTPSPAAAIATSVRRTLLGQFRYRFLLMCAAAVLLALFTLGQATTAFDTSYELFRGIAEVNSTTVDASESALQYIAQASQAAADYALLTSDTPLYEQAQNDIFRDFASFRDQMTILSSNLQSDEERTAYTVAETFTYSRFWRHVSNLVAQRSNDAVARREYLDADNHIRSWINPALQELETLNFEQMVAAGENAGSIILGQIVLYAIPAVALAALLFLISQQIRRKVRRYLTPGIDAALVVSIGALVIGLLQLWSAPGTLNRMIQDAYLNVSASSRILVDANVANRAESSALLDSENADLWYDRYEEAISQVELRLCGRSECANVEFVNGQGDLLPFVVEAAQDISDADSERIGGINPLVANIANFSSSSAQRSRLEGAREAFLDFKSANATLRELIDTGDIDSAIIYNTSTDEGTSQQAFDRLDAALNGIITADRDVFEDIWASQSATLQNSRAILGTVAYGLIAILVIVGVYHRFREL